MAMKSSYFITAIGTEIGKTYVTASWLRQLSEAGHRVQVLKPVVSGFSADDAQSDPAILLQANGQEVTSEALDAMSPWRFSAPISPHLAARAEDREVTLEEVAKWCRTHISNASGVTLIEGAGGVMSPLTESATNLDLIAALNIPAVLVTSDYLGSISHTLTALTAMQQLDVPIHGVVVNACEGSSSHSLQATAESIEQFSDGDVEIVMCGRGAELSGLDPLINSF